MSACADCLRRAWVLGALNGQLEYRGRAPERLAALLGLGDEELVRAVAGREAEPLLREYRRFEPSPSAPPEDVERICRHDSRFPVALAGAPAGPTLLHVAGDPPRVLELLARPAVAIVGTRAASDYGIEVAHGLARDLAASGVTVLGGLADGIAAAAHGGALQVGGPTVTAMAGGVDVCRPARRRGMYERICAAGGAIAELPCGQPPRGWCHTARARILVALARVVVVVEARERAGELVHARLADQAGRTLAAVPGRLGSPLASGPHALLREGAPLVRDAQDVLELLCEAGDRPRDVSRQAGARAPAVEPGLQAVLDAVGTGCDTIEKLVAAGADEQHVLVALARLELGGAIVRGDAGRYLARV